MKKGFSLVELLISLIIISIITAAFAPVITKKLKYQNATILLLFLVLPVMQEKPQMQRIPPVKIVPLINIRFKAARV